MGVVKLRVIDLFAGCGGLSTGFMESGFKITYAVEFDKSIADTYIKNHNDTKLIVEDIKNVDNSDIFQRGMAEIIVGGPPCQGFSMAGARIRHNFTDDSRNYLFKHYYNIVNRVQPKIFVMENVKGIATMNNGEILKKIFELFVEIGYTVQSQIFKASDFGIPQTRERMIIIGILCSDWNFESIIKETKSKIAKKDLLFFNKKTVWDVIADLEHKPTDGSCTIKNHTATNHNDIAQRRMKKISNGENYTVLNEDIKSVHSGSYGRLEKNGLAPTITTRFDTPSGGKFIHPTLDRTITPREAARIQSFPDKFVFFGNKTSICKQIGNAVPPKFAYFLAEATKEILKI